MAESEFELRKSDHSLTPSYYLDRASKKIAFVWGKEWYAGTVILYYMVDAGDYKKWLHQTQNYLMPIR